MKTQFCTFALVLFVSLAALSESGFAQTNRNDAYDDPFAPGTGTGTGGWQAGLENLGSGSRMSEEETRVMEAQAAEAAEAAEFRRLKGEELAEEQKRRLAILERKLNEILVMEAQAAELKGEELAVEQERRLAMLKRKLSEIFDMEAQAAEAAEFLRLKGEELAEEQKRRLAMLERKLNEEFEMSSKLARESEDLRMELSRTNSKLYVAERRVRQAMIEEESVMEIAVGLENLWCNGLSDEPEQQLEALDFLELIGRLKRHDFEFGAGTQDMIQKLATSDNADVRSVAIEFSAKTNSDWAIANGYQVDNFSWLPLEAIKQDNQSSPRAFLNETIEVDYDEVLLKDVVVEWENLFGFKGNLSEDDGELSVTLNFDQVRFVTALQAIMKEVDRQYAITDARIVILPSDAEPPTVALTYEIRGLISESQKIETVLERLGQALGETNKIKLTKLSESRFVASGSEAQQVALGKLLAKLPRTY